MNLFEQYGIKEVADVTLYNVETDGTFKPYLFLDTLKVSTIEQTADESEAKGGKGNATLISWDFNKEIKVTIEDALYSPKSMGLMFGGAGADGVWNTTPATITKAAKFKATATGSAGVPALIDFGNLTITGTSPSVKFYDEAGAVVTGTSVVAGSTYIALLTTTATASATLVITPDGFPGVFKLVGDTFARSRNTGKDEFFQFIIHRAKMSAAQTITLQSDGDPSVFNFDLKVLRPEDNKMMELIQYTI